MLRFAEVPFIVTEMERRVERIKYGRGVFFVQRQSERKVREQ